MNSRNWIGLLLILFGIGFILQQANMLNFTAVLSVWWPLIFIIIGVIQLFSRAHFSFTSGIIFIFVGVLVLINQWVDINVWVYLWPAVLIIIGLSFLFPRSRFEREDSFNSDQYFKTFTLFSGANVKNQSSNFKGGTVTSIFGGAEIDVRYATIQEEGAAMEILAIFGGATIFVPDDIKVVVSGTPIFGGWDDRTANRRMDQNQDNLPVLKIHCQPIFGGVEIKN